jgi:hypothetical protein
MLRGIEKVANSNGTILVQKRSHNYWNSKANQLLELKKLEQKLNIQQPTDWYSITQREIIEKGGKVLISKYNDSLSKTLSALYPDIKWELTRYIQVVFKLICSDSLWFLVIFGRANLINLQH